MTQADRRIPGCLFVASLLLGLFLTAVLGYSMIYLPLRVNLSYVETSCVVLDKRLDQNVDEDGLTTRPLFYIEYNAAGLLRRVWTYDASGISSNMHDANLAILKRFEKGQHCTCWYDPDDPDRAVLTRSFSWWGLMVLVSLTLTGIGAGGLIRNRRPRATSPAEPSQDPLLVQDVFRKQRA
jgi:hypothetical protein